MAGNKYRGRGKRELVRAWDALLIAHFGRARLRGRGNFLKIGVSAGRY